jgi:threonine synthase
MSGFYSTLRKGYVSTFKDAVLGNVPSIGGLFIPQKLEKLCTDDLKLIIHSDLPTTASIVLSRLIGDEIPQPELLDICKHALRFDTPIVRLDKEFAVLELFHGPTLAFKDVGVGFMAEVIQRFSGNEERTILTATTGDTGAAVAGAFFKRPKTRVIVIYPKGRISKVQEQQIAGLGENVHAYAVNGSFDDCQRMVNEVFANKTFVDKFRLTSANSINLARLLPQVAYYARAWAQLQPEIGKKLLFSVPSGNFGNVTAALIAREIGIPIDYILATTNENDTIPRYLSGGSFEVSPVHDTLTTAMDIASPNNFSRIEAIFGPGSVEISKSLLSVSVRMEENESAMKELYSKYNYISDPHGALAYAGSTRVLNGNEKLVRVFLETAHPVKFPETVSRVLGIEPEVPQSAKGVLEKKISTFEIGPRTEELIGVL